MSDDEYAEYLKQRIKDAFGLDDLIPEEQAYWDEYDRAHEEKRRLDEAHFAAMERAMKEYANAINTRPEVLEPYIPGISAAINEFGLRFVWGAK